MSHDQEEMIPVNTEVKEFMVKEKGNAKDDKVVDKKESRGKREHHGEYSQNTSI